MRCPECATADLDADARFCGRCGALLRPHADPRPSTRARPQPDGGGAPDEAGPRADAPRPARTANVASSWLAAAVVVVLVAGLSVVVPRILRDGSASWLDPLEGERWRTNLGTEPAFRFDTVGSGPLPFVDVTVAPTGVYVTAESTVAAYGPDHGDRRWQRVLPDPHAPTIAGPVLVVVTAQGVVALDPDTGEIRWEEALAGRISVATDGEHVFLARPNGVLALTAADGRPVWNVPTPGGPLPEVLIASDGQAVVVGTPDGYVRALDGATGQQRWERSVNAGTSVSPVVGDDNVYVESRSDGSDRLVALDARSGRQRWEVPVIDGRRGTLAAAGGVVLRRSIGEMAAFAADDGRPLWSDAERQLLPPVAGDDAVYLTRSSPSRIVAVDATTGATRWSRNRTAAAPVAVGRDALYLVRGDAVVVWDTRDGTDRWQVSPTDPDQPPGHPTPVLTAERVYVTTVGGPLVALDRRAGDEVWRFDPSEVDELPTENPTGTTSVALPFGDRVVVASDRAIYALDAADGEVLATFATSVRPGAVPVLAGGLLVIDLGPSLIGLDPTTLRLQWQYTTPTQGARIGSHPVTAPTVHGEVVLVGGGEGTLAALDPTTGDPVWDLDLGAAVTSRPVVADRIIVVRTEVGDVRAFDVETGRARWRHGLSPSGLSDPAVSSDTVHVADGRTLIALDLETGTERWRTDPGSGRLSAPTSVRDAVYVGTAVGELLALNSAAGEIRWRFPVDAPVSAAPAVTDGELVAVTDDGTVVSLR